MKRKIIVIAAVACVLVLSLAACSSSSGSGSGSGSSSQTTTPWPSGSVATKIPKYTGGEIVNVTESPNSVYILIAGVSQDEAMGYWNQAQADGFTHVQSKTEPSQWYSGFTYVADNGQGVSLSVTYAPGEPNTMSILAIQT